MLIYSFEVPAFGESRNVLPIFCFVMKPKNADRLFGYVEEPMKDLVFLCHHDCENPFCDVWVAWVW